MSIALQVAFDLLAIILGLFVRRWLVIDLSFVAEGLPSGARRWSCWHSGFNVTHGNQAMTKETPLTGWMAGEESTGVSSVPSPYLSGDPELTGWIDYAIGLTAPTEGKLVIVLKLIERLNHLELPLLVGQTMRSKFSPPWDQ